MPKSKNPVVNYYHSWESLIGYRSLGGIKHFGYYPKGKENISKREAQLRMDDRLAEALALPAGSTLLDAGCGEGGVSLYLAKKYDMRVHGVDILDFNITRAKRSAQKQHLEDVVQFQVASYQKLPFKDSSFDGLYTMETLVHSPDYQQALREFHRVLKPGGRLVLFEYSLKPNNQLTDSERRSMEKIRYINRYASMPAFNDFTWDTMDKVIAIAGFRNVTITDITARMLPMLQSFATVGRIPYAIARLVHGEKHIINAMSAVVLWDARNLYRYNVITADKRHE